MTKSYPWARVFIELALRALRRVHHDYIVWSIGYGKREERKHVLLNQGRGIELADERTVCAAITQEYIYSGFTSGCWINPDPTANVEGGVRYWQIERETKYPNSRSHCDLIIWRVNEDGTRGIWQPAYIEAKRARLWTSTRLGNQTEQPPRNYQITSKKKDIKRLRRHILNGVTEWGPFAHLLIWNVLDKQAKEEDTPEGFIKQLDDPGIRIHQNKWVPLAWDDPHQNSTGSKAHPKPTRSLWVCLAEIDPMGRAAQQLI